MHKYAAATALTIALNIAMIGSAVSTPFCSADGPVGRLLNANRRRLCATIDNNQKTEREAAMRQFMMAVIALNGVRSHSGDGTS
jgi:hypothetical protein